MYIELEAVHHYDTTTSHQGPHRRESVYRFGVEGRQSEHAWPSRKRMAGRVKINVKRNWFYEKQNSAQLYSWDDNSQQWHLTLTAAPLDVHKMEMWETEDALLYSFARFLGLQFHPSITQSALVDGGYVDENGDYR